MYKRLDIILTEKGLTKSRTSAKQLIELGNVFVNGRQASKASSLYDDENDSFCVDEDSPLLRYVGRGGLKLETAIESFGIELEGKVCLDVGASTGGFTDCMLKHGAKRVYAVDIGYSQLCEKLKNDSRVISLENLNILNATQDQIPEKVGFVSIDVSIVSLKDILPGIVHFCDGNAEGAALIKPQYEADRSAVGKNGIVKDNKVHEAVIKKITDCAKELGFLDIETVPSKITGGDGNREFLMHFRIKK